MDLSSSEQRTRSSTRTKRPTVTIAGPSKKAKTSDASKAGSKAGGKTVAVKKEGKVATKKVSKGRNVWQVDVKKRPSGSTEKAEDSSSSDDEEHPFLKKKGLKIDPRVDVPRNLLMDHTNPDFARFCVEHGWMSAAQAGDTLSVERMRVNLTALKNLADMGAAEGIGE